VGAMVLNAADALGRAHALFGAPGDAPATGRGTNLADATNLTRADGDVVAGMSGRLPGAYGAFSTDAAATLDGLARSDDLMRSHVDAAGAADRNGHSASGRVVDGAVTDIARMAPLTGTPAGQRALVTALRDRVSQQQQVVAAHRARDARLAALLRAIDYDGSRDGRWPTDPRRGYRPWPPSSGRPPHLRLQPARLRRGTRRTGPSPRLHPGTDVRDPVDDASGKRREPASGQREWSVAQPISAG
jgi:hypothetical protein